MSKTQTIPYPHRAAPDDTVARKPKAPRERRPHGGLFLDEAEIARRLGQTPDR